MPRESKQISPGSRRNGRCFRQDRRSNLKTHLMNTRRSPFKDLECAISLKVCFPDLPTQEPRSRGSLSCARIRLVCGRLPGRETLTPGLAELATRAKTVL